MLLTNYTLCVTNSFLCLTRFNTITKFIRTLIGIEQVEKRTIISFGNPCRKLLNPKYSLYYSFKHLIHPDWFNHWKSKLPNQKKYRKESQVWIWIKSFHLRNKWCDSNFFLLISWFVLQILYLKADDHFFGNSILIMRQVM